MSRTTWTSVFLLVWTIINCINVNDAATCDLRSESLGLCDRPNGENQQGSSRHGVYIYGRDELINIGVAVHSQYYSDVDYPPECVRPNVRPRSKQRRRGTRAGARVKFRNRRHRPYVPAVTFGNVRSLCNKIDELRTDCRYLYEYRESCIIGITESWLDCSIPNSAMDINGFNLVRNDRVPELCGKKKGGGVALYINDRWCNNICVKKSICTPDIELLSVSVRPFYLPREFTNVYVTIVYIAPDAVKDKATKIVYDSISDLSNNKPDALHLVFGDANHCVKDLKSVLNGFVQCVSCCTREQAMIDPFYCNVKNSYKCKQLPPLKSSDHNMIHMIPSYRPKLKQIKPTVVTRTIISEASMDTLNACFDLTDWNVFIQDADGDVNVLTDLVTSYIEFCSDLHLEKKQVKQYPNNKPWITSELRNLIVDKHKSYGKPDYKDKQKLLDDKIYQAKRAYKDKVESLFKRNSSKDAWRGLKMLTGMNQRRKDPSILLETGAADRLNQFYARFDNKDYSVQQQQIREQLNYVDNTSLVLQENLVRQSLNRIKCGKATGPDNLSSKLLKGCKDSLFMIIHYIFQLSLRMCVFPDSWKIGKIVPVPKKDLPKVVNDLRPVTLTPILSKCLEYVGKSLLMPHVKTQLDPLQFAYINGRSTEDAICVLMHRLNKHLDCKASNTARALFIDYSSAFNTIQPHLMINKLSSHNVPEYLQLWTLDFLTHRSQYVCTSSEVSNSLVLNTGAPQGCVLSPVLFVLYTNDLTWNTNNVFIEKYADDTVIVGLSFTDDDREYFECIEFVNKWCAENFLELNVQKTKELVWDFRRVPAVRESVIISDMLVEKVSSYKYLGLIIDDQFTFSEHVLNQARKVNSRLYYARRMRKLNVNPEIIAMFYNVTISPVINYACVTFYDLLTMYLKHVLDKPRRTCAKLLVNANTVNNLFENTQIYEDSLYRFGKSIMKDLSHPLNGEFKMLPSGRRLRVCRSSTNRYKFSFVPRATVLMNDKLNIM